MIPEVYRKRTDWILLLTGLALLVIGLLSIYSATHVPGSARHGYILRHLVFLGLGTGVFAFFFFLPLRLWEDGVYVIFALSLVMLVLVLVAGDESYGSRRWFRVGPFKFQPSEFAKLALVGTLARILARKRADLSRAGTLILVLALLLLPALLVLKQPDLGTAAAFPGLALPMLIWAGIPGLTLFLLLSPLFGVLLVGHTLLWVIYLALSVWILVRSRLTHLVLAAFLVFQGGLHFLTPEAMSHLEPYQRARVTSFLNPEADPSGAGYQGLQSRIALGSGGAFGKGYLQGSQKALAFLPAQHNDFIFSVVGEEWGFAGCALVVLLFGVLIYRGILIAKQCRGSFGSLLAVGLAGLIFFHATVNMAMTMGLFPVTGLPLPFLSYGGSFLLTMMAALGQLSNVAVHRYDY